MQQSEEKTLELLIARHGESAGNIPSEKGCAVMTPREREDPELTQRGLHQAELLGERLSHGRLDAIFASTLIRAILTANEVAVRQKEPVKIEILPELLERGVKADYVPYSFDEIRQRTPLAVMRQGSSDESIMSAVSYLDEKKSRERALSVINYIRSRFNSGERVLLVAHGCFNTDLICAALGFDYDIGFGFCQHNTCLTKVKYYADGHCRAAFINDTSHLYGEDKKIAFTE